jgi:hypothetical protein
MKYEYKTTNQKLIMMVDFAGERKYEPLPLSPPGGISPSPWRVLHVHVFDHFDGPRATIIWEHAFE